MSFPAGSIVTVETNPCFFDLANDPVIPAHVYLAYGAVTYDSVGDRSGPNLTVAAATWTDPTGDPSNTISQDLSVYTTGGAFMAEITPGTAGVWEWRMWGDGPIQATTWIGSFEVTDVYAGWPEPYGYCNIDNVQAMINSGQWNVNDPTAWPKPGQVQDWIRMHSADIDMQLAVWGFRIPVSPADPTEPVMPQAWLILRKICTELVVAEVLRSKHGSQDENTDSAAREHFDRANTILNRIEAGDVNFTVFNVAGPFKMVPDMGKGILGTGQNDTAGNPRRPVDQGGDILTTTMSVF